MESYNFKYVGNNVTIYPMAKIVGAEHLEIGSNVIIDDFVFIQATGPCYIGNYVHIASFTSIAGGGTFCLEDFSGLSSGVRVITGTDDFLGGGLTNPTIPSEFRATSRLKVLVKAHAIIGTNSVILPGVTIATGAAVGAISLVRKDLSPWKVYAGNPLREVRDRPREQILRSEHELFARHGEPDRLFRDLL
jgi:acetyltransferase-like isoleucine patch superfamily enzyme